MYKVTLLVAILAAGLLLPSAGLAQDVLAGVDLLVTVPGATYQDFAGSPLPADFFYPGSDPFTDLVNFEGVPLGTSVHCRAVSLGATDTIIRRLADAVVPAPPSTDVIPIEIVELQLVSVSPITVTPSLQSWIVEVDLSTILPSQGTMTINKTHANGGTFDVDIRVVPRFTFTEVGNPGNVRVFDGGSEGAFYDLFANGVDWVHQSSQLLCPLCGTNFLTGTDGVVINTWVLSGPSASHGVKSPCEFAVPVEETTWGSVKALYDTDN